jgi:hypothetical protein
VRILDAMTTRLILALALALSLHSPAAEPLKQKVNLLDLIKAGKVTYHVDQKPVLKDPPEKIWSFLENGQLKISGRGFGYVRTNENYRDYHLVIEHKFTGPTVGTREGKARDNGIFVHCHGPDGAYGGTWMAPATSSCSRRRCLMAPNSSPVSLPRSALTVTRR